MLRPALYAELAGCTVDAAAAALGLRPGGRGTWGPCPACGADRRGASERRGPVGATNDGRAWRCHRCGAGGDVAALVAAVAVGSARAPGAEGWAAARALAVEVGLLAPDAALERAEPSGRPVARPAPVARPGVDSGPVRALAPAGEVARLWSWSWPVEPEGDAAAWLRSRALDPDAVRLLDLARELPPADELAYLEAERAGILAVDGLPVDGATVPAWAALGRSAWSAGWRVVLPTWGPTGAMVGLRARWCLLDPRKPPFGGKEVGGTGIASGPAVYADPVGRWLLERGPEARAGELAGDADRNPLAWRWSGAVVVAEGGPDWLTLATAEPRAQRGKATAAILGLWSGGWTAEIGARLPSGCVVRLAVHDDGAGDGYAERVRATIPAGCRVEVVR
jgi:hypothetical protein